MRADRVYQEPPCLDRKAHRSLPLHTYPGNAGEERMSERPRLPRHTLLVIDNEPDVLRGIDEAP